MIDLEPIKARMNAATPGYLAAYDGGDGWSFAAHEEDNEIIAFFPHPHDQGKASGNARFFDSARTDIPNLIQEVEQLRKLESLVKAFFPLNSNPEDHDGGCYPESLCTKCEAKEAAIYRYLYPLEEV